MRIAQEHHLHNETHFFLLGDPLMGHSDPTQLLQNFEHSEPQYRRGDILQGLYLPLEQPRDGGFPFRVVLGDCSPEEEMEWLASAEGRLDLHSGQLAVCGGHALLIYNAASKRSRHPSREVLDSLSESIRYIRVPHGSYRVRVLAYLPGQVAVKAFEQGEESLGAWFRRSYPGRRYPPWLIDLAYESQVYDPEENWERIFFAQPHHQRAQPLLHYVIQLQWLDANQEQSQDFETTEQGALIWQTRRPERCPLGLAYQSQGGQQAATTAPVY